MPDLQALIAGCMLSKCRLTSSGHSQQSDHDTILMVAFVV